MSKKEKKQSIPKTGSVKWHLYTGEKNPIAVFKSNYENEKLKREQKIQNNENIVEGKSLFVLTVICALLSYLFYPELYGVLFALLGLVFIIFFLIANLGGDDGKS